MQEMFYKKEYSATRLGQDRRTRIEGIPASRRGYLPDFVALAEAHGAKGLRVEDKKGLAPALQDAFATDGPVVIECRVKQEENVYPMVPPGASLSEMVLSMV